MAVAKNILPLVPQTVIHADGGMDIDFDGNGLFEIQVRPEYFFTGGWRAGDSAPGQTIAEHSAIVFDFDEDGFLDALLTVDGVWTERDDNDDGVSDWFEISGSRQATIVYPSEIGELISYSASGVSRMRDTDFDGRFDLWETGGAFDSVDDDGDGVLDIFVLSAKVQEIDIDGDETADVRVVSETYVGLDQNGDRIIDVTYKYGGRYEERQEDGSFAVHTEQPDDFTFDRAEQEAIWTRYDLGVA